MRRVRLLTPRWPRQLDDERAEGFGASYREAARRQQRQQQSGANKENLSFENAEQAKNVAKEQREIADRVDQLQKAARSWSDSSASRRARQRPRLAFARAQELPSKP